MVAPLCGRPQRAAAAESGGTPYLLDVAGICGNRILCSGTSLSEPGMSWLSRRQLPMPMRKVVRAEHTHAVRHCLVRSSLVGRWSASSSLLLCDCIEKD